MSVYSQIQQHNIMDSTIEMHRKLEIASVIARLYLKCGVFPLEVSLQSEANFCKRTVHLMVTVAHYFHRSVAAQLLQIRSANHCDHHRHTTMTPTSYFGFRDLIGEVVSIMLRWSTIHTFVVAVLGNLRYIVHVRDLRNQNHQLFHHRHHMLFGGTWGHAPPIVEKLI